MLNLERLLTLLEQDGKLSDAQLATMLDSTAEEIRKTIKRLEKDGIIKGYRTTVNWQNSDIPSASALIEVKVTPQRDTGYDEIAKRIMEFPEVESVYLMSGGYDLAVVVKAPTMNEVAMFVSRRLAPIGGILSTATHFVLTRYKDQGTVFCNDYEEIDERGSNLCD